MEYPWYKHYPEHVPRSLNYPVRTLFDNLRISAEKYPNNTAVVYKDVPYSYKNIYEFSKSLTDIPTNSVKTILRRVLREREWK